MCPEPIANYIEMIKGYMPKMPPGDFAEFGCYNGGHVARLAALDGRPTWAFDTFKGMPKEDYDPALDSCNPPGKFDPNHDVIGYLSAIPNIKLMVGRFEETLPQIPPKTKFAMVYVDCDYYASHIQVLNYLEDHGHITPGTVFVFDDYGHLPGTKKAVDEWRVDLPFDDNHEKVIIYAQTPARAARVKDRQERL